MRVTFVQDNGVVETIDDAAVGQSLMEVGRAKGVEGILADCGGGCACATCHVYVDAAWWDRVGPPDAIENEMLDMVDDIRRDTSRLSCQIKLREDLDGLLVTVAPT
ncbi:MAG TPA: 2Fe-2S iron-sulfur cluster-binding protein [Acetobacteraceae bacterium]|nr:2Fe-2S iron-sulfur cluster-binding protein [Acetobacteraceae bacterium]